MDIYKIENIFFDKQEGQVSKQRGTALPLSI